jgi:SdrD B-like domain
VFVSRSTSSSLLRAVIASLVVGSLVGAGPIAQAQSPQIRFTVGTIGNAPPGIGAWEVTSICGSSVNVFTSSIASGPFTFSVAAPSGVATCDFEVRPKGPKPTVVYSLAARVGSTRLATTSTPQPDGTILTRLAGFPSVPPGDLTLLPYAEATIVVEMGRGENVPPGQRFEVNLACDKGGTKETFTLGVGERYVPQPGFDFAGTNCLVTQLTSVGSVVTYTDNSNLVDDRRVVLVSRDTSCPDPRVGGAALLNTNCWTGVLISNGFPAPTTTTVAPVTSTLPVVVVPASTSTTPPTVLSTTAPTGTSPTTTRGPVDPTSTVGSSVVPSSAPPRSFPTPADDGPVVSGFAFRDSNRNGRRDSSEPALTNARIQLVDAKGRVVRSVLGGVYRFDGFLPGRYTVRMAVRSGRSWRVVTTLRITA